MIRRSRPLLIAAALAGALTLSSSLHAQTSPERGAAGLQLLISVKQSYVAPPDATRIVLHLHNSTSKPLWLFRRAKGWRPAGGFSDESVSKQSGSTVELRLSPESSPAGAVSTAARARILEYVEMPRPKLVKVAAGADYEETAIAQIEPASADGKTPLWGTYKIAVVYAASYPNHDVSDETLGVNLWAGEVASNTVTLEMRPPLPDSTGEIDGKAVGADERPHADVRVSLSDSQGQLIDQRVTEGNGQFSFSHLPFGLYYVSARRQDATDDTLVFTHQELASSLPHATVQLTLVPSESEDPKKFVHKPVLIRVVDSNHQPAASVAIDAVFTNGPLIDDLKAATDLEGAAAMGLIPGRNAVSLKMRGCKEQVERADVSPGPGADVFRYVLDCAQK